MKIEGLNHITLAVSDLAHATAFYRDVMGFSVKKAWSGGVYFDAGGLWFCLSPDAQARKVPHPDYTHIAFSVSAGDFAAWVARLKQAKAVSWKENKSEGASFYFLDPDGHKLELHVGALQSRLQQMADRAG